MVPWWLLIQDGPWTAGDERRIAYILPTAYSRM